LDGVTPDEGAIRLHQISAILSKSLLTRGFQVTMIQESRREAREAFADIRRELEDQESRLDQMLPAEPESDPIAEIAHVLHGFCGLLGKLEGRVVALEEAQSPSI